MQFIIDTAMRDVQFSFFDKETCLAHFSTPQNRNSADKIHPQIQEVLEQHNLSLKQMDTIIVTSGPGSFTGIRVGLSTARSLGLALDVPVFGVTTLQAMSYCYPHEEKHCICVDTRRGDFFCQNFASDHKPMGEIEIKSHEQIQELENVLVDKELDLSLINAAFIKNGHDPHVFTLNPSPLYVRDADAEKAKNLPDVDWSKMEA